MILHKIEYNLDDILNCPDSEYTYDVFGKFRLAKVQPNEIKNTTLKSLYKEYCVNHKVCLNCKVIGNFKGLFCPNCNTSKNEHYQERVTKTKNTINKDPDFYHRSKSKALKTIEQKYGDIKEYYSKMSKKSDRSKSGLKASKTVMHKYGVVHNSHINILNYDKYFDAEFVKDTFIYDGYFHIHEYMNYFNVNDITARKMKKIYGITHPNKHLKIKTQQKIFESILCQNKTLNYRCKEGFELDIFLKSHNIAIEYNGLMFHSQNILNENCHKMFSDKPSDYHLNKSLFCLNEGIQLYHIFEGENLDTWSKYINSQLKDDYTPKPTELKYCYDNNFIKDNNIIYDYNLESNICSIYDKNDLILLFQFNIINNKLIIKKLISSINYNINIINTLKLIKSKFISSNSINEIHLYHNFRLGYLKTDINPIVVNNLRKFYFKSGNTDLYEEFQDFTDRCIFDCGDLLYIIK